MEASTESSNGKQNWNEVVEASAIAERKAGERPAREFEEVLACRLTETEMAEIARAVGKTRQERRDIENKLKVSKDHWKAKLDGIDAALDELGEKAEQGKEHRPVRCREDFLYETGCVRVTRLDTGEVIRERAMLASERQPNLPGVAAGSIAAEEEDDDDEPFLSATEEQHEDSIGDIDDPAALIDASGGDDKPKKRGRKKVSAS